MTAYEKVSVNEYLAAGEYSALAIGAALSRSHYGPGTLKTSDGNKRGNWFSKISEAPPRGNHASIETAFNGDFSRVHFALEHRITGADTLGTPATGYQTNPEAGAHYTYVYNESGWNQQTATNGGRTGVASHRVKLFQAGQGDLVAFNPDAHVTSTRAGSTHFLANPAVCFLSGSMTAGVDGAYFNPYETDLDDCGFDVAAVGLVNRFRRSNDTGAKSAVWMGYRGQSEGAKACDALISATGKWHAGLDLAMTGLDFGPNKAAVSLKCNDRIYLNNAATALGNMGADWRTTVFNGDYVEYSSTLGGINFVRGGQSKVQIGADVSVVNACLRVDPDGDGTNVAKVKGLQTGFALPTGTSNTGTFDTATVTTTQLAQYVKGLVERLHSSTNGAHALIGA
jgi:hypothetical protein